MQANHNDEDWAIISSSSDMEDEQSTGSSISGDRKRASVDHDNNLSSVATLKLPVMKPTNESTKDANAQHDQKGPETVTEPESDDKRIDRVINFYEDLSLKTERLNNSIKQRSNDLYNSVAKLKLDQFNRFISSNDTAEAVDGEVSSLEQDGNGEVVKDESDLKAPHNECMIKKTSSYYVNMFFNDLQDFLDDNSEYLIYYFATGIIGMISLIGLYYNINWISLLYKPQPVAAPSMITTSLSYVDDTTLKWKAYLENLIYEDSHSKSNYFGLYKPSPSRTIKISRWVHQLKYGALNELWVQNKPCNAIDKYYSLADELPNYIYMAKASTMNTINKYANPNLFRLALHRAKLNIDNSARFIFKSSYPVRKFIADSMYVL